MTVFAVISLPSMGPPLCTNAHINFLPEQEPPYVCQNFWEKNWTKSITNLVTLVGIVSYVNVTFPHPQC